MFLRQLNKLVGARDLSHVLELLSQSEGFTAKLMDAAGNPLLLPSSYKYPKLCRLIQSCLEGQNRCRYSYYKAGLQAAKFNEPFLFRCHAGLMGWAIPVGGLERGATVICGQAVMPTGTRAQLKLLEEIAAEMNLDYQELKQALDSVPQMVPSRDMVAAEAVYLMVNYVNTGRVDTTANDLRKAVGEQAPFNQEVNYLRNRQLGLEKELLHLISRGEREASFQVLAGLLRETGGNGQGIEWCKNRAAELLALISRAAVDAGVPPEEVNRIKADALQKLMVSFEEEKVYNIAAETLSGYFRYLQNGRAREENVLEAVKQYIEEHFGNPELTVGEIAGAVYLSPSYLSRLFKKELGITISQYIIDKRLAEARRLLRETSLPVAEIGEKVGYCNASYFVKLFKITVGVTPLKYRVKYKPK